MENAPTAGAEAASPGNDIDSESSKTTSTLSSKFANVPTGNLVDTTPGNFSVSASVARRADESAASVPVIDPGETPTRQTVVEQVRSGVAVLGLNTNNNPPSISTAAAAAAAPPALAEETLDGGDCRTSLRRPIDIYPRDGGGGDSLRTEDLTSTQALTDSETTTTCSKNEGDDESK